VTKHKDEEKKIVTSKKTLKTLTRELNQIQNDLLRLQEAQQATWKTFPVAIKSA
jgi:hypothetical protein